METNRNISPEHMINAAYVCDKYCSKTAALTTFSYDTEETYCRNCVHWNDKPCTLYTEMCSRIKGDMGP